MKTTGTIRHKNLTSPTPFSIRHFTERIQNSVEKPSLRGLKKLKMMLIDRTRIIGYL